MIIYLEIKSLLERMNNGLFDDLPEDIHRLHFRDVCLVNIDAFFQCFDHILNMLKCYKNLKMQITKQLDGFD